jgi:hypothetical protein
MVDFLPDWLRLRGLGWNSMVPHGWSPILLNVKSAMTHRYDEGLEGDHTVFGLEVCQTKWSRAHISTVIPTNLSTRKSLIA